MCSCECIARETDYHREYVNTHDSFFVILLCLYII